MAIGCGGEAIAAGFEYRVDLVMGGKEALCLSGGLEAAHDFLSSSRRPVTALDPVVEPFVGPVIGPGCPPCDWLRVAAQLVGDDHPRLAELSDQPCQKSLGGFGIAACLNQDVECVTIAIDGPPQPVLYAAHLDHDLVQVPLVVRLWSVPAERGPQNARQTG